MEALEGARRRALAEAAPDAADALVATARRGIEVYVVVEKQQQDLAVLRTLTEGGVDVRVDGNGSAMHHKFVVVDGVILATGSFNWTQNAEHRNDENLVVLYDEDVAAAFAGEFQRVWDEGVEP